MCCGVAAVADLGDSGAFHVGHDLPHLHGLAGRHFVNSNDDLIVRGARGALEELP